MTAYRERKPQGASRRTKVFVALAVVAGAAAALASINTSSEPEPAPTREPGVFDSPTAPALPPEPAPLDLDPWEVTPTNAPEPPDGQMPAWVATPEPPADIAVVEEAPPPPVDPPEPWETPWTETSPNAVP